MEFFPIPLALKKPEKYSDGFGTVLCRMHSLLLKEALTILELTLWKAMLLLEEKEEDRRFGY
jgi:hypothetical protein